LHASDDEETVEPREPDVGGVHVPLRKRMPGYLASFGVGLAVTVVIGLVVWAVTDVSLVSSVANTIFFYGIALFLIGGVSGGGFTNRSARTTNSIDDVRRSDHASDGGMPSSAARHPRNHEHMPRSGGSDAGPKALWQVLGGGLYVAIGLFIVVMWS